MFVNKETTYLLTYLLIYLLLSAEEQTMSMARCFTGQSVGLEINRLPRHFHITVLGKYFYVPLSPSSIIWCWPSDGDALRL